MVVTNLQVMKVIGARQIRKSCWLGWVEDVVSIQVEVDRPASEAWIHERSREILISHAIAIDVIPDRPANRAIQYREVGKIPGCRTFPCHDRDRLPDIERF